jgi:hypothetical protein
MLRSQLSWLYDELVEANRLVQYVLTAAEAINGLSTRKTSGKADSGVAV